MQKSFIAIIFTAIVTNFTIMPFVLADQQSPYNEDVLMENTIYQQDEQGNTLEEQVASDDYGNAQGNEYDLAKDGAFKGYTVAIMQLYTGEKFDFRFPSAALKEKGFSIIHWKNTPPHPEKLKSALANVSQLWIISDEKRKLKGAHLKVIQAFFDSGKGVYIWGDNKPYYADANYVASALLNTTMYGNVHGDQIVGLQEDKHKTGILPKHMLTTGLQYLYEGITIATIRPNNKLKPLIYGSANNVVAAIYDHQGKRAILDGGFTRLFIKWDTAGTGRYIKNAAAWLVNYEKFAKKKNDQTFSKSLVVNGTGSLVFSVEGVII